MDLLTNKKLSINTLMEEIKPIGQEENGLEKTDLSKLRSFSCVLDTQDFDVTTNSSCF